MKPRRKTKRYNPPKGAGVLAAFVVGQATQIILHALSMNFWESSRIPFCTAAGFLVAVAVFAGMYIARPAPAMSYQDWAQVPGDRGGEMDLDD